jgi:hypothetical protein
MRQPRHGVSTDRTRIECSFDLETVGTIKASVDHDLAVSGAGLASTGWRMDLIDEVHLLIAPILVGGDNACFPTRFFIPSNCSMSVASGNGLVFVVTP